MCVTQLNNEHIAVNHWSLAFTHVTNIAPDHPKCVIIGYSGNHTAAVLFPRGTVKSGSCRYVRTQLHIIRDIQQSLGWVPPELYIKILFSMVLTVLNSK